ncbi:hypothetical protein MD484_g5184, partial [Candolleomyces efflorescens]
MSDEPPHNRIPVELLCEIFSCVTFLDSLSLTTYPFHVPASHRAPLLLTKVCSQWRDIVFNTPTLWSSLAIDMERVIDSEPKRRFYRFWLDRAWGTPVSLYIFDVRRSDAALLKNNADWIDFLLDHAPNIKNILTGPHVFNALLQALHDKPDYRNSRFMIGGHLEGISCVLNGIDNLDYSFHGQTSTLFPKLRQVDISSSSYTGFGDLQIHKLTHLSANFGLLEVLRINHPTLTFHKLVELYLYPSTPTRYRNELDEFTLFVFPELRFLKIFDSTEGLPDTRRTLAHFECPQLDTLQIENLNPMMRLNRVDRLHTTGDFEFLAEFLKRSSTSRQGTKRGIKYFVTRHRDFLDAAFFNHPTIRSNIEFVQVNITTQHTTRDRYGMQRDDFDTPMLSTPGQAWNSHDYALAGAKNPAFARAEAQKQLFADTWKAHNLDVMFNTGTTKACVGWSRIRNRTVGKSFIKEWEAAFWDKGPYVECIEQSKGAEMVPY